jgi:uncharacterized protein (DUF849 family)
MTRVCTGSLILGGHARVGLEDSLHVSRGVLAKSSADQVQRIVTIGWQLGIEPAMPDEARKFPGLKGLNQAGF